MAFVGAIGILKDGFNDATVALVKYDEWAADEADYLAERDPDDEADLWTGPVLFVELIDGLTPAQIKQRRIEQLREDSDAW